LFGALHLGGAAHRARHWRAKRKEQVRALKAIYQVNNPVRLGSEYANGLKQAYVQFPIWLMCPPAQIEHGEEKGLVSLNN
jgi:hypothetical protein